MPMRILVSRLWSIFPILFLLKVTNKIDFFFFLKILFFFTKANLRHIYRKLISKKGVRKLCFLREINNVFILRKQWLNKWSLSVIQNCFQKWPKLFCTSQGIFHFSWYSLEVYSLFIQLILNIFHIFYFE